MQIIIKNKNTIFLDEFKFKCVLGVNGISLKKKEGDLKTPKGTFTLGPLFYRRDKISKIKTQLKKIPIKKNMYWCNDIKSKYYNKLITSTKFGSYEKMFRKDDKYNLVIVINYNTKKIIKKRVVQFFYILQKIIKKLKAVLQ